MANLLFLPFRFVQDIVLLHENTFHSLIYNFLLDIYRWKVFGFISDQVSLVLKVPLLDLLE